MRIIVRSGHHGFSTMGFKRNEPMQVRSGSYSIVDDVHSIGYAQVFLEDILLHH